MTARSAVPSPPSPLATNYQKIKKLGRFNRVGHRITGTRHGQSNERGRKWGGPGWEFAHVAIDDHSRVARIDIFPGERKKSAIAFLKATVAFYRALGVKVDRVLVNTRFAAFDKST